MRIKAALLEVLDPAPVRRQHALAAWRKNFPAQPFAGGTGRVWTEQERMKEFERLRSIAVAEYEALPVEERDPEELQQYVQMLRETILEPP